jgi:hypothetical protein
MAVSGEQFMVAGGGRPDWRCEKVRADEVIRDRPVDPEMTWWTWLIVSLLAWVAVDVLVVVLFAWRPPWLRVPRPNGNGPEG